MFFLRIYFSFIRGGIVITVTGENLDSVEEPVMVVTVMLDDAVNVYYQVVLHSHHCNVKEPGRYR